MNGFERVSFNPGGTVSVSKNGITIPVKHMCLFPDFRCNLLQSGDMFALEPNQNGDLQVNAPSGGTGRIARRDAIRYVMKRLGVKADDKVNLNTWVDDGCLVFGWGTPAPEEGEQHV